MTRQETAPPAPPTALDDVKGWFPKIDQMLFTWFLERQERLGQTGDLVELGSYLGKSAILMGRHRRPEETFTVCDLFDSEAPDDSNQAEMNGSYASLTRTAFEANYRAFHDRLPEIIQAPTSVILDHVEPESCRFVHVDASHLYEHVRGDIQAARVMLPDTGVIVCDDYRSEHTPGVAAAVWEAVAVSGLRPVCVTTQKLYGTWGDADTLQDDLLEWLGGQDNVWHEIQRVAGRRLIRVKGRWAASGEVQRLKDRLARSQEKAARLEDRLARTRAELADVRGSVSFKVGRSFTALPRVVRRRNPGS
ncbi:class I SAM-dependent methyltransferase [Actinomadura sp. KC216]|uniref:class I SAM-dependent methyltransferase n=1 Tax=Actinomadura sp. KC216 TaxID=2530370 RepID=UPI001043AA12|nr:class I SAM-dependent methyltransferase [Actinomadura sp. KC216]TDB88622.1 class I SAM-dependent methyltransferase [Actinomadura sp. KC216]